MLAPRAEQTLTMPEMPKVVVELPPGAEFSAAIAAALPEALVAEIAPGSAVVIVTHDQRLAARCDRTIEIVDGRLKRDEVMA